MRRWPRVARGYVKVLVGLTAQAVRAGDSVGTVQVASEQLRFQGPLAEVLLPAIEVNLELRQDGVAVASWSGAVDPNTEARGVLLLGWILQEVVARELPVPAEGRLVTRLRLDGRCLWHTSWPVEVGLGGEE